MSKTALQDVKQALMDAGVEIYRAEEAQIQVAERVRFHIMDSGVRVCMDAQRKVVFTARSQRSDFPNALADDLFAKVRGAVGVHADPHGYVEMEARTVEVRDPVDESRVLDVWHEVTYVKHAPDDLSALVDEVRWALGVEKYVVD